MAYFKLQLFTTGSIEFITIHMNSIKLIRMVSWFANRNINRLKWIHRNFDCYFSVCERFCMFQLFFSHNNNSCACQLLLRKFYATVYSMQHAWCITMLNAATSLDADGRYVECKVAARMKDVETHIHYPHPNWLRGNCFKTDKVIMQIFLVIIESCIFIHLYAAVV